MIARFSDHAANERTFLAWVRTVFAIEGFGLVVARLRSEHPNSISESVMLGIGTLVILIAYVRMRHLKNRIDAADREDTGEENFAGTLLTALLIALTALIGAFLFHTSS